METEHRYKRALRSREAQLSDEAFEAWSQWTRDELDGALDAESVILTDEEITVKEKGGRVFFYVEGVKHEHDLSSAPSITDEKRLKAHVASVKFTARKGKLIQGEFTAAELQAAAKTAKDEARDAEHVISGEWQIIGVNADNERTEASERSGGDFAERLSKKLIDKIFAADPEAVKLSLYAESYWLDKELPLVERWEMREPCGEGACFEIRRASK